MMQEILHLQSRTFNQHGLGRDYCHFPLKSLSYSIECPDFHISDIINIDTI